MAKKSKPTSTKTEKPKKRDKRSIYPNPGRPIEVTDDQMEDMLHRCKGQVYSAAAKLGCCPETIYQRMKLNPHLRTIRNSYKGQLIDMAENGLWDAVDNKEPWAITFTLRTQGRGRGYVERKEMRVGGDKNAPPVQSQTTKVSINLDDLPLEMRMQLLEIIKRKKAQQAPLQLEHKETANG